MGNRKISAVMAVYNREKYLEEAIESVLNQSYSNLELILVNDASTDSSDLICKRFAKNYPEKIKYINLEVNGGAGNTFDTGTIHSTGEFITFVGSDDVQHKEKFKICIDILEKEPNVNMVFSNYETTDSAGVKTGRSLIFPDDLNNNNLLNYELRRNYLFSGLCVMRNSSEIRFDINLRYSEDFDLFLGLVCKGYKVRIINDVLASVRIHEENLSAKYEKTNEAVIYILNKYDFNVLYEKLKLNKVSEKTINITFGIVSILKEQFKDAIYYLTKAKSMNDGNNNDEIDNLFYLATAYYYDKQFKKANLNLYNLLGVHSGEPTVYNNIGIVEYLNKNYAKSKEMFLSALKIEPLYMDARLNLKALEEGDTPNRFTTKFLRKNVVHVENCVF